MKKADKQDVIDMAEAEGFDYTFRHYSNFEDIKDKRFHELRNAYLSAMQKLSAYIGFDDAN